MSSDLTDSKTSTRTLWAAGDYDKIAELFWDVGVAVAGAVPIEAGMRVLDVGTGTGSAAIRAAEAGAEVVALDIAPEHFDAARRRAEAAGVEVEWVEGDAEALPFQDDSFDRVLSSFGSIFAFDPDAAAHEMVRVCRPGGEVVMATWTTGGFGGRLSDALRSFRSPLALGPTAPSAWGTYGHVRRTLGGQLVLAIEPGSVDLAFDSVDAMLGYYEEYLGPLVVARSELAASSYAALRSQVRALIESLDAGDGETLVPAEYQLVIGHKPVADLRPNV